ncbi:MAG TPA: hypothetical protein VGP45_03905 [Marinobacter sp.]|nr:hypothetical protein [Marinobacter sp.]
MIGFPRALQTSDKTGIARVRVDQGSTGFFDNREFRYFRYMEIPSGESRWTIVVVGKNGISLKDQDLLVDSGAVDFFAYRDASVAGLTPVAPAGPNSGVFPNNSLPDVPVWDMRTSITEAGNHTGTPSGVVAERARLRSAGATAQRTSISASIQGERGVAPGTYYLRFSAIDGAAVVEYFLTFEERTA